MTYLRWATLAVVMCFFAMACATTVDAAQTRTARAEKDVSATKDTAPQKKKAGVTKAKDKKKAVSKAHVGKNKKSKTTAQNSKNKKKNRNKKASSKALSERDVWMQRAKGNSELLGDASWYGSDFHGGKTASGAEYDMYTYTAAHRTLPMGTVVEVTEETTGRSVMVCINNRGPFSRGRVIDLSYAAAKDLGIKQRGVAPVNLRVVSDPEGQALNSDEAFYVQLRKYAKEDKVGPFRQFADASVMKEVLRTQYPEASIVLGPAVASN